MLVIGLTGGIGMGKSTLAAAFRRAGVPVFDADAEVHRLQAPGGRALPAIARLFPGTVQNGVLDRTALRARVIGDDAAMRALEVVIHPMVRAGERAFLGRARRAGRRIAVLDIPLLFETGSERRAGLVVVASAPYRVQVARVRARRKLTQAQTDALIARQMPDAEKRRRADLVVRTGLSRFQALRQIRRLLWRLSKS